jgi:L-asparaginase II
MLLQCSDTYSYIYQQSVCCGAQVIAITAAPAAKRYKFQHFNVIILCKSKQKKPHRQRKMPRYELFFII